MPRTTVPNTKGDDTSPQPLPALLTVEETARYLRIGRTAAYEGVRSGTIPHVRLGKLIRVPTVALLAWLEAGGEQPNEAASAGEAPAAIGGVTRGGRATIPSKEVIRGSNH